MADELTRGIYILDSDPQAVYVVLDTYDRQAAEVSAYRVPLFSTVYCADPVKVPPLHLRPSGELPPAIVVDLYVLAGKAAGWHERVAFEEHLQRVPALGDSGRRPIQFLPETAPEQRDEGAP